MLGDGQILERRKKHCEHVKRSYRKDPSRAKKAAARWRLTNIDRAREHSKTAYQNRKARTGYSERYFLAKDGLKRCYCCKEVKSLTGFTPNQSSCKACRSIKGPEGKRKALANRVRTMLRQSLKGNKNTTKSESLLGYTIELLRFHLEVCFKEGMSWENMSEWHIDHVRPLSSFSIKGPDCADFKKAWSLENLQPLWAIDNLRKGAKWEG